VETNPSATYLISELGAASLLVRALEISLLYPLAWLLSKAISSERRILGAKRIYLFSFVLLISILPAASFADLLGDVLVVRFMSDVLSGAVRIFMAGLAFALLVAGVSTLREWSLPTGK